MSSDNPSSDHSLSHVSRRAVLVTAAAGAGAAALAACSPNSSGGGGGGTAPTEKAGTPLAKLSVIPVGSAVSVQLPDGSPGIVARPTAATVAAFSAVCTHMQCTVAPQGDKLVCPCHGSVYSALTGAVEQGPAPSALAKVSVSVVGGVVETAATT